MAHYTTCALCGKPVDQTLPPNHPGAAEVDEIIPVSLGGSPYEWRNCQLAHRLCNQKKGNRIDPPPQEPKPTPQHITSRPW